MSEFSSTSDFPLSRAERKRLLVLACASDRTALVRACFPKPRGPLASLASEVLQYVNLVAGFLPGRLGRLLRTFSTAADIGRHLGLFRL